MTFLYWFCSVKFLVC